MKKKEWVKRACKGFTMIELVVVAAIVGILAAMAIPAYSTYIKKSRRTDAMVALRGIQFAQEKYRGNNPSYASDLIGQLKYISSATESGYYTIAVSSQTATGYTLTATPVAGKTQASDTSCPTIVLTQNAGTISTTPTACWSK